MSKKRKKSTFLKVVACNFVKITRPKNKKRILGMDNWSPQNNEDYHANAKKNNTKLAYTKENCTDEIAVTDKGPGNEIKKRVTNCFRKDLESSQQRLEEWKNGEVSAGERRILFTKWLGDSWEDYCTNHQDQITLAFKKCGMFNDINGRENHLVKLDKMP